MDPMDYTPENIRARVAAADTALVANLETDRAVQSAQARLEQAQTQLDAATAHKGRIAYLPGSRSAMKDWHSAVASVQAAKTEVTQAETGYRQALNAAAAARWSRKLQEEANARQEARDLAQGNAAMLEELNAKQQFLPAWVAAGGTEATFEAAWSKPGGLWEEELRRRTEATLAAQRRNSKALNAF